MIPCSSYFWMFAIMQHEQFSETWYNMGPSELQGAEATKTTT